MQFLKNILASFIGVILAVIALFSLLFLFLLTTSQKPEPYIRDNSVLTIGLSGSIPDRISENPLDELFRKSDKDVVSLKSLNENLKKAVVDKHIRGIWIKAEMLNASWATLEEVRNAILNFKKNSGKFVYCSTNDIGFNEKSYFVATAADSIFSPPESTFEFDGFFIQTPFLKGLFDKLGIKPEISRQGKYKSAVEPFIRKDYSEANKEQLTALLDNTSKTYLDAVSKWSGKSIAQLNNDLNQSPHLSADYAYKQGLINKLTYPEDVKERIKRRIGLSKGEKLYTISNKRYNQVSAKSAGLTQIKTNNKIAIIYAEGEIVPDVVQSPFDHSKYITASAFRKELKQITDDSDVKALVVRVNSPGGSGSTSDLIWEMLRKTSKKMPVIASMGSVAASGGYYIAMAADTIVAMPSTITGSIGVFGTKFNMKNFFNDKLGVTFDVVQSHNNADWLMSTKPFTNTQEKAFQRTIDNFYENFITKAAESRHVSKAHIDSIGEGHIWTGQAALNNHLVDVLGNLHKAVQIAADKAGIKNYNLVTYPRPEGLWSYFYNTTQTKVYSFFNPDFGNQISLNRIKKYIVTNPRQIQALLPFKIVIQ
ncbi:MAG TPA: signal peptide peptidase SppA [Balneolales bacterium]|nr:signal peptide peptidase SppA [Balneolales bacterium]